MDERVARCAGAEEEREAVAHALFGKAWAVPHDTYITDEFPLLLYRLSRLPGRTSRPDDDRAGAMPDAYLFDPGI